MADSNGEDDEWEYEYHESLQDEVYITLDLSTNPAALPSTSQGKKKPAKRRRIHHKPPVPAEDNLQQQDLDHDLSSRTASLGIGPNSDGHLNNISLGEHGLDPSTSAGNDGEPDVARLQILELLSSKPVINYQDQIYTCQWASTLGTTVILAPGDKSGVNNYKPLASTSKYSVVATSRLKLIATPATLVPRPWRPSTPVQGSQAPVQNRNVASNGEAPGREALPRATGVADIPGGPFLDRLTAIKALRGDTDVVRYSRFRDDTFEEGDDNVQPIGPAKPRLRQPGDLHFMTVPLPPTPKSRKRKAPAETPARAATRPSLVVTMQLKSKRGKTLLRRLHSEADRSATSDGLSVPRIMSNSTLAVPPPSNLLGQQVEGPSQAGMLEFSPPPQPPVHQQTLDGRPSAGRINVDDYVGPTSQSATIDPAVNRSRVSRGARGARGARGGRKASFARAPSTAALQNGASNATDPAQPSQRHPNQVSMVGVGQPLQPTFQPIAPAIHFQSQDVSVATPSTWNHLSHPGPTVGLEAVTPSTDTPTRPLSTQTPPPKRASRQNYIVLPPELRPTRGRGSRGGKMPMTRNTVRTAAPEFPAPAVPAPTQPAPDLPVSTLPDLGAPGLSRGRGRGRGRRGGRARGSMRGATTASSASSLPEGVGRLPVHPNLAGVGLTPALAQPPSAGATQRGASLGDGPAAGTRSEATRPSPLMAFITGQLSTWEDDAEMDGTTPSDQEGAGA